MQPIATWTDEVTPADLDAPGLGGSLCVMERASDGSLAPGGHQPAGVGPAFTACATREERPLSNGAGRSSAWVSNSVIVVGFGGENPLADSRSSTGCIGGSSPTEWRQGQGAPSGAVSSGSPKVMCGAAAFSNLAKALRKTSSTLPTGPLRCLATMISATFWRTVSASY